MGDAIHLNVPALAAAGTNMVAGYVTGTPDIQWTQADFALFAGQTVVTIDQGATGSPVPSANVRDVEAGAWTVGAAVQLAGWTTAQPTIYCSASTLPSLEQSGWQGAVWVADYVGQAPSSPYPVPAGMTCVAWQWTDQGGNGAYDLSVVFDPTWPGGPMEPIEIPGVPGQWVSYQTFANYKTGVPYVVGNGTDGTLWMTQYVNGAWTTPVAL
jgi:hypothetical protein